MRKIRQYFILVNPAINQGLEQISVKPIKSINVAGNKCFFHRGISGSDYTYALSDYKTGLRIAFSDCKNFKLAELEIMTRINEIMDILIKAYEKQAGRFKIINN
jgi:hypothetical protein